MGDFLTEIYGYFAGATFANQIGLTTQMPAVLESVTSRESTKGYTKWQAIVDCIWEEYKLSQLLIQLLIPRAPGRTKSWYNKNKK